MSEIKASGQAGGEISDSYFSVPSWFILLVLSQSRAA